jgi:hypothetical protein
MKRYDGDVYDHFSFLLLRREKKVLSCFIFYGRGRSVSIKPVFSYPFYLKSFRF